MGVEFAAIAQVRNRQTVLPLVQQANEQLHLEDGLWVPTSWLQAAMPRLTPSERQLMLRHKIIPYCWLPGCTIYGVVHDGALRYAQDLGFNVVGRIPAPIYRQLVRHTFGRALQQKAEHGLARQKPWASAHLRLSSGQKLAGLLGVTLLVAASMMVPVTGVFSAIQLIAGLFFLLVVGLRSLCMLPLPPAEGIALPQLHDNDLPVYTVLVPLFRETEMVGQLVRALRALDYPEDKLDIKIILEESDRPMHAAVRALNLPWNFDVIIVPPGTPQTKPRALNYAMQFARGSLATIYDSEDLPNPDQLRLAAEHFASAGDDLACLQASLDLYNPNENWLTRQFAAEYAALFHVVLPALAAYGLPLPLGGTSNHFRVSALEAVGSWDAFNVTEDADLGIRLARHGYLTGVLPSSTYEEATSTLGNWMKQRRRWLKGFLQTWLVHNRNPLLLMREVGLAGFCAVQVMTLGVFASSLLHPMLLLVALWNFLPEQLSAHTATTTGAALSGLSLAVLLAGYVSAIGTSRKGLQLVGAVGWTYVLCSIPIYWLLVSAAAWMALWDFVVSPFHWHKTKHGLSRSKRRQAVR